MQTVNVTFAGEEISAHSEGANAYRLSVRPRASTGSTWSRASAHGLRAGAPARGSRRGKFARCSRSWPLASSREN